MNANKHFDLAMLRGDIDKAALIVALVHDRDDPIRADFAHVRLKEIVEILQAIRSPQSGAAKPLSHIAVVPAQLELHG